MKKILVGSTGERTDNDLWDLMKLFNIKTSGSNVERSGTEPSNIRNQKTNNEQPSMREIVGDLSTLSPKKKTTRGWRDLRIISTVLSLFQIQKSQGSDNENEPPTPPQTLPDNNEGLERKQLDAIPLILGLLGNIADVNNKIEAEKLSADLSQKNVLSKEKVLLAAQAALLLIAQDLSAQEKRRKQQDTEETTLDGLYEKTKKKPNRIIFDNRRRQSPEEIREQAELKKTYDEKKEFKKKRKQLKRSLTIATMGSNPIKKSPTKPLQNDTVITNNIPVAPPVIKPEIVPSSLTQPITQVTQPVPVVQPLISNVPPPTTTAPHMQPPLSQPQNKKEVEVIPKTDLTYETLQNANSILQKLSDFYTRYGLLCAKLEKERFRLLINTENGSPRNAEEVVANINKRIEALSDSVAETLESAKQYKEHLSNLQNKIENAKNKNEVNNLLADAKKYLDDNKKNILQIIRQSMQKELEELRDSVLAAQQIKVGINIAIQEKALSTEDPDMKEFVDEWDNHVARQQESIPEILKNMEPLLAEDDEKQLDFSSWEHAFKTGYKLITTINMSLRGIQAKAKASYYEFNETLMGNNEEYQNPFLKMMDALSGIHPENGLIAAISKLRTLNIPLDDTKKIGELLNDKNNESLSYDERNGMRTIMDIENILTEGIKNELIELTDQDQKKKNKKENKPVKENMKQPVDYHGKKIAIDRNTHKDEKKNKGSENESSNKKVVKNEIINPGEKDKTDIKVSVKNINMFQKYNGMDKDVSKNMLKLNKSLREKLNQPK
jgi:hypothetical protein